MSLRSPRLLVASLPPHRSLGCWAATLLALACCAAPAAAEERALPDVLLLTVDTLRADHVGSYGHPQEITPNIDRLAQNGAQFDDAITVIGKTAPAFASLFTSLHPPTHGARRNGIEMRSDVPVLAELLKEAGYTTAGFVSNWTLRTKLSGLGRGFDYYDEDFNKTRYVVKGAERDAPSIAAAVLEWLAANRRPAAADGSRGHQPPLFLWVHFSEPHVPYESHPGYTLPEPEPENRENGWQKRWRYASEVHFTDYWIGELLEELEPYLPGDRSIRLFLADHGESLGEHDYWGHGKNTYWPNLRIPMVISAPTITAGTRVASPVSIVDVLPSLLDLLGLEVPKGIEGRSFIGSWHQPLPADRPRYAIGTRHTPLGKGGDLYQDPLMISQQTTTTKTIWDFSEHRLIYFDLQQDPKELHPLAKPPIETVPPLRRQLANWYRTLPKYEPKTETELTPEDIEKLKSLGYIGD